MGLSRLSDAEVAAWVAASCAEQGVPVKVTDPTVVRRVGALLGAAPDGARARKRSGTRAPSGARSVAPHDAYPLGVEFPGAGAAGADVGVVDEGFDDGVLSVEIQARPGAA